MSKGIRATPWTLLKTALLKPPNVLWQFKRVKKGALWERRRLWLNLDNADDIREILDVPDCQIVLRIDRQLTAEDGTVVLHDTPLSRALIQIPSPPEAFYATSESTSGSKTVCSSPRIAGGMRIAIIFEGLGFRRSWRPSITPHSQFTA